MKNFRIYNYSTGRITKPAKSTKIKHDYKNYTEADAAANLLAESSKGQTLIVDFTEKRKSKIVGVVEWFNEKQV